MYKILAIVGLVASLFVSCSDNSSPADVSRVASFEIEGMVCEMGCGASLRKGLYTTDAVDEVEVDYEEERNRNVINVYYSSDKTNTDDMLKVIEELNEGQFKAKLIEDKAVSENKSKKSQETTSTSSGSDVEGIEASTKSFSLPNLTELLNSLIY